MKDVKIPRLFPYLMINNTNEMLDFYQRAFGFELFEAPMMDEQGRVLHAELCYRDALFMFGSENSEESISKSPASGKFASPLYLYMEVDNVDAFFTHAKQHGAKVIQEPKDQFYGHRTGVIEDPEGYYWSFATPL